MSRDRKSPLTSWDGQGEPPWEQDDLRHERDQDGMTQRWLFDLAMDHLDL